MSAWWNRASVEQRLAQIDGGIECGMTARQVALCSGFPDNRAAGMLVGTYANKHGRAFAQSMGGKHRRRYEVADLKRSYWQGGRDFADATTPSVRVMDADFDEAA